MEHRRVLQHMGKGHPNCCPCAAFLTGLLLSHAPSGGKPSRAAWFAFRDYLIRSSTKHLRLTALNEDLENFRFAGGDWSLIYLY